MEDYLNWGLNTEVSSKITSESNSQHINQENSDDSEKNQTIRVFQLVIDIDIDIGSNKHVREKTVELIAHVFDSDKVIKVGFKAWCVHLEVVDDKLILQNLAYKPICAKDMHLPTGLLGTLPMLKASIKLACKLYPLVEKIYFTDTSGFADNKIGESINLPTRDLCLYGTTWYQRNLPIRSDLLNPVEEKVAKLYTFYKECLNTKVNDDYINTLISEFIIVKPRFKYLSVTNLKDSKYKSMTYQEFFKSIYEKEGNLVYRLFMLPFIKMKNLTSIDGDLWSMKLLDVDYRGLTIQISDEITQQGGSLKKIREPIYVEKIKMTKQMIARQLVFVE